MLLLERCCPNKKADINSLVSRFSIIQKTLPPLDRECIKFAFSRSNLSTFSPESLELFSVCDVTDCNPQTATHKLKPKVIFRLRLIVCGSELTRQCLDHCLPGNVQYQQASSARFLQQDYPTIQQSSYFAFESCTSTAEAGPMQISPTSVN